MISLVLCTKPFKVGWYHSLLAAMWAVFLIISPAAAGRTLQDPLIFEVAVNEVGDDFARIEWKTDQLCDSQIEYGLDENYGATTPLYAEMVYDHLVELSGLEAGESYHYRLFSRNALGEMTVTGDFEVTLSLPTVSNLTTHSAMIQWRTAASADTYLEYGLSSAAMDQYVEIGESVNFHRVTLQNLASGSEFFYRVISLAGDSVTYRSPVRSFTTYTPSPPFSNTPPTVEIGVVGSTIENNQITVQKGETVQFIGSGSSDPDGDLLQYRWTFGDGNLSDDVDPEHIYRSAGTYTVGLCADDEQWPEYETNPFVIRTPQPASTRRPVARSSRAAGVSSPAAGNRGHDDGRSGHAPVLARRAHRHWSPVEWLTQNAPER